MQNLQYSDLYSILNKEPLGRTMRSLDLPVPAGDPAKACNSLPCLDLANSDHPCVILGGERKINLWNHTGLIVQLHYYSVYDSTDRKETALNCPYLYIVRLYSFKAP